MSTITLYARKVNRMPSLIRDVRSSVREFRSEVEDLRNSTMSIDSSVCNLDDVIASLRASSNTQEEKLEKAKNIQSQTLEKLEDIKEEVEEFIDDVVSIDEDAAEAINQSKDDFYDEYYYLKPDCEKSGWEKFKDGLKDFGNWCKEHWKQIVITAVIIIGAVITIVAVVATGGLALVPLLTALGISASTAAIISGVIGVAAIAFAGLSAIVNVVDVWNPLEGFWKGAQNVLNWGNLIFGGLYNIGSIYNAFNGITTAQLRAFGQALRRPEFVEALKGAQSYRTIFSGAKMAKDGSMLWAGLGTDGANVSAGLAGTSRETLGQLMARAGVAESSVTNWASPSVAYVLESSGQVTAYIGSETGMVLSNGSVVGNIFLNYEILYVYDLMT